MVTAGQDHEAPLLYRLPGGVVGDPGPRGHEAIDSGPGFFGRSSDRALQTRVGNPCAHPSTSEYGDRSGCARPGQSGRAILSALGSARFFFEADPPAPSSVASQARRGATKNPGSAESATPLSQSARSFQGASSVRGGGGESGWVLFQLSNPARCPGQPR